MGHVSATTVFLGTILLAETVYSFCPNSQVCECTASYINCTCKQGEAMDLVPTKPNFQINELVIKDCGRVRLAEGSLADNDIQSVRLLNLQELHVEPLAFQNGNIQYIRISGVNSFTAEDKAFARIKNVSNFVLNNVIIEKLMPEVFSETTFSVLVIKNSKIMSIEASSFHPKEGATVTIENNTIASIETGSFSLKSADLFTFSENTVRSIKSYSFTFNSVQKVEFKNCRLEEIETGIILGADVGLLEFHRNYIRNCEERAFSGLRQCRKILFVDNRILITKNNSLIPNEELDKGNVESITSENNEIGCDCGIEWVLAAKGPKYIRFKETNFCYHPADLRGLRLSELEIEKSKDEGCTVGRRVPSATGDVSPIASSTVPEVSKTEHSSVTTYHSTVIVTEDESNQPISSASSHELIGPCDDDEEPNGNSTKVEFSTIVLLLGLIFYSCSKRFSSTYLS